MPLDSILSLSGADRAGLFLGKQGTEAPECPGRARAVGPSTPSSLQVRRLQCRARERAQDPSRWTSPGVPRGALGAGPSLCSVQSSWVSELSTPPRPPLGPRTEAPPPEPAPASDWPRCTSVCARGREHGRLSLQLSLRPRGLGSQRGSGLYPGRRVRAGGGARPAWRRRGVRRGSGSALGPPQVGAGVGGHGPRRVSRRRGRAKVPRVLAERGRLHLRAWRRGL